MLTLLILVAEVVVGFLSNSLALLSDGGHILTDVFALGVAWLAVRRARRPADERHTFGYGRTGILAALGNASLLIVIAAVIGFEALARIEHTQHISGFPVLFTALVAVAANTFAALRLRREGEHDLNIRAALWHVAGDIAASLGVVMSSTIIIVTGAYVADPIASWLIALLIAIGAWRIVTQATSILMEAAPSDVDLRTLVAAMGEIPGIENVHDLHVWSLSDGLRLLSAHVIVPDQSLGEASRVIADARLLLSRRFGIQHATIELECSDCAIPLSRPITMHDSASTGHASSDRMGKKEGAHQWRTSRKR